MWLNTLGVTALLVLFGNADCQTFSTKDLQTSSNGSITVIPTPSSVRTDDPTSSLATVGKSTVGPSSVPPSAKNSHAGTNTATKFSETPSPGSQSSETFTAIHWSDTTSPGSQPLIATTPGRPFDETIASTSDVNVTDGPLSSSPRAADTQNGTVAPSFGSLVSSTRRPTGSNGAPSSVPDVTSRLGQLQNSGDQNLLQNLSFPNVLQNLGFPNVLQKILQQMASLPAHLQMSTQCSADLAAFQTGLEHMEPWTLQMIDAMGKPQAGILLGEKTFVGQYDECQAISQQTSAEHVIQGLFCTIQALLASVASILFVDVCLPVSCRDDIQSLVEYVSKALGVYPVGTSCVVSKDPVEDKLFWVTIGIIALLTLLCVWGTAYGVFLNWMRNRNKAESGSWANYFDGHINEAFCDDVKEKGGMSLEPVKIVEEGQVPTVSSNGLKIPISHNPAKPDDSETEVFQSKSLCAKLLLSFSVLENGTKLLRTENGQGDLSCLHGIRVITITWVILGHAFIMPSSATSNSVGNSASIVTMTKDWTMTPVVSGTLSVDSFFLLSGCLTSYLFLRQTKKAGGVTCRNMVLYYVHRFWRLTPLYMVSMMFFAGVAPYLMTGPYDNSNAVSVLNCRKYWWANLLYVNNLVDMNKLCMAWSWYLSDDMQFYIIAPLMLVPWAFGKRIVGILFCIALIIVHIVTNSVFITRDKLQFPFGITTIDYMKEVYFPPWTRVAPFAVGLMLGYVLHSVGSKYKMRPLAVLLGWLTALAAGLTSVYVQLDNVRNLYKTGQTAWGQSQFAAYECLSRPVWACAVAWVVLACCTGYGGFVNTFLSWRGWAPLSRLTYGVYLFHLITLYVIMGNKIAPFHLSAWTVAELTISITVLTYMVSFVFSLLVESPTLGLEKVLLGGAGKSRK